MCRFALPRSKNHLFVSPAGGGWSYVVKANPQLRRASGVLHGVRYPLPQADTHAAFHRSPDALHSPLCADLAAGRTESACPALSAPALLRLGLTDVDWACRARFHFGDWNASPPRSRARSVRQRRLAGESAESAGSRSQLDRPLLMPTQVHSAGSPED